MKSEPGKTGAPGFRPSLPAFPGFFLSTISESLEKLSLPVLHYLICVCFVLECRYSWLIFQHF